MSDARLGNSAGANERPNEPGAGAFPATDYWRLAPQRMSDGDKEWSHFAVLAPDCDLLANFSLSARRTRSGGTLVQPRVAFLFRDADGAWEGDVETFPAAAAMISEGSPDAAIGDNRAWFENGCYKVRIESQTRDARIALDLHPVTAPLLAPNVRLSGKALFSWAVVPRLRADGVAEVSGRRRRIRAAPAYHDRNWGRFAWGGDTAWEWATILPPDSARPWSLVYSRITDRVRSTTISQSLLLWRGARLSRKFYGRDLKIERHGALRCERPLRVPRAAALAIPGPRASAPGELLIAAQGYGDALRLRIVFDDLAQVVFPTDRWPGMTLLTELRGRAEISGRIGAEPLEFEARVQAEINHAA